MILFRGIVYDSFSNILELMLGELHSGIIDEEGLVITYYDCNAEVFLTKGDLERGLRDMVEYLSYDRDDEEGNASEKVLKLLRENLEWDKILSDMPIMYYPQGEEKEFDLRELHDYIEYLEFKKYGNR